MDTTPTDETLFDQLHSTVATQGIGPAMDQLITKLDQREDYQALFYALLLKKRVELGVSPFPTGPAAELPSEAHEPYEDAIREAGRKVGGLYLAKKQIARAWGYFRMLDEPQPVIDALEKFEAGPDDDVYGAVEVAWQQGLSPQRGFDLVLNHHGICAAITMLGNVDLTAKLKLRDHCVTRLVNALHAQLHERIVGDLQSRGVVTPADATIPQLLGLQPEAFGEGEYHVDVSHLNSVVQMAMQLTPCDELAKAIELSQYGERLSPTLRADAHPPFENSYADYTRYLCIVNGDDVEAGLKYFEAKLPMAAEQGDTFPVEVFINLLVKLNRLPEAVTVARQYLGDEEGRELSCPTLSELARRANDFATLAESARASNDPVSYLASLIASARASCP